MKLPKLKLAKFIRRVNRFVALMECDGYQIVVHVANTGRMAELMTETNPMYVAPVNRRQNRKTAYDLALVRYRDVLVGVDSRMPNLIMREAIQESILAEFRGYGTIKSEVTYGGSRLDFRLSGAAPVTYLETKSVNLVRDGVALFPDAPTQRGKKHLDTLLSIVESGYRASAVFVIQRSDAKSFKPNAVADSNFVKALTAANSAGVDTYAYNCEVNLGEIRIASRVPVELD